MSFAVSFDLFNYRDGNTYLETFVLSTEDEQAKSDWSKLVTGDDTLILYSDNLNGESGDYIFFLDPESVSGIQVIGNDDGTCSFYPENTSLGASGFAFKYGNDGKFYLESVLSGVLRGHADSVIILGGLGADDLIHISDSSPYTANVDGDLYIVDDLGGAESESNGILGFLGDFWDTFKTFLTSLFIPSDGFFTDWYNEIKAAFDAKFGALSDLYNQLTGFFSGITSNDSSNALFDDKYFGGILSSFRNIITGISLLQKNHIHDIGIGVIE